MKIFGFKVGDDIYELFGNIVSLDEPFELNIERATKNGVDYNSFGEAWRGKLDANNAGESAMAAYVNDDTTVTFTYVCDEIRDFKEHFQTYTHKVGERNVPDKILTPSGKKADLYIVIKTSDEDVFFCYFGDEISVITAEDGSTVTDIPEFVMGTVSGALENGEGEVLLKTEKGKRYFK